MATEFLHFKAHLKALLDNSQGIEIESEKVCKQVSDQVWKQVEDIAQGLL